MEKTLKFHILSLPHTQATIEYISCAYTAKARNFATMMSSLGHDTFLYAGEETDADVTELVTIVTRAQQTKWFGKFDYKTQFYPITWGPNDTHWKVTNYRAIAEINDRLEPGDFICLIAGECQRQVAEAFPNNPVVEYGIGYRGCFANFKVFESYSHMNYVYGNVFNTDNGQHYDAVIPNYFNPDDFYLADKEDYYVFLGRFTQRKGVEIAVEATRKLGAKLIMAGQGCRQEGNKFIGDELTVQGDHLSHIGHVNVEERAKLLSGAKACFMPTTYLEPFGGVSIEALLSGTPVVATDYGVFPETIKHGLDGYRFRTIGEAAYFASDDMLAKLPAAEEIRQRAIDRFSMDVVRYKYEDYFLQLQDLSNGGGFYSDWHGRDDRYQ